MLLFGRSKHRSVNMYTVCPPRRPVVLRCQELEARVVPDASPVPWPSAVPTSVGRWSENGRRWQEDAITYAAGATTYTLGARAEARYEIADAPIGSSAGPVRASGFTEYWFIETDGGYPMNQPTVRYDWTWERFPNGVETTGVLDPGPNPFVVPPPPAGQAWTTITRYVADGDEAKGIYNGRNLEYQYSSAGSQSAVTVSTPGGVGPDGTKVATINTDGSYAQTFSAQDWAGRSNSDRQGTLTANTSSTGTFSSRETATTTFTNQVASKVVYGAVGKLDGTESAVIDLTDYAESETPGVRVKVDLVKAVNQSGKVTGRSNLDLTLVPTPLPRQPDDPEWATTDVTFTDSLVRETTVVRNRNAVSASFTRTAAAGYGPFPSLSETGSEQAVAVVTDGKITTSTGRRYVMAAGVVTEDKAEGLSSFTRTESARQEGGSSYIYQRESQGAIFNLIVEGQNDYLSKASGTYSADESKWTRNNLTGSYTVRDELTYVGERTERSTDEGTAEASPTQTTTTYSTAVDLTGPVYANSLAITEYVAPPAVAAVAGPAVGTLTERVTFGTSSALTGTVESETTSSGPNQFTVNHKKTTTFADGDLTQSAIGIGLVRVNGLPQAGFAKTETVVKGKDEAVKTTTGTVAVFGQSETRDLTERWTGVATAGLDRTTVTFTPGVQKEVRTQDKGTTTGYAISGTDSIEATGGGNVPTVWASVEYTPNLDGPDGKKLSRTDTVQSLTTAEFINGTLTSGTYGRSWTGKSDATVKEDRSYDLTVPGYGSDRGLTETVTRTKTEASTGTVRVVAGGRWTDVRSEYSDFTSRDETFHGESLLTSTIPWEVAATNTAPVPWYEYAAGTYSVRHDSHRIVTDKFTGQKDNAGETATWRHTAYVPSDVRTIRGNPDPQPYGDQTATGSVADTYTETGEVTIDYTPAGNSWVPTTGSIDVNRRFSRTLINTFTNADDTEARKVVVFNEKVWRQNLSGTDAAWTGTLTDYEHHTWRSRQDGGEWQVMGDNWVGSPSPAPVSFFVEPRWQPSRQDAGWMDRWEAADVARVGFGLLDVGAGAGMALTGAGVIPGVVLMAVGIDQALTGIMNLRYGPTAADHSAIEAAAYSVTGSDTAARAAPVVLSLGASLAPAFGRAMKLGRAAGGSSAWAETDWLGNVQYGRMGSQTVGPFRSFLDAHESIHVWLSPAYWVGNNGFGRALSFVAQVPVAWSPTFRAMEEAAAQTFAIWRTLGFRYAGAGGIRQVFRTESGDLVERSLTNVFRITDNGTAPIQGLLFPLRGGYGARWIPAEWAVYGTAYGLYEWHAR